MIGDRVFSVRLAACSWTFSLATFHALSRRPKGHRFLVRRRGTRCWAYRRGMCRSIAAGPSKAPIAQVSSERRFRPHGRWLGTARPSRITRLNERGQGESKMKTHVTSFMNLRVRAIVRLAAMLTFVLFAGLAPHAAYAQTCHDVLQGHVDWAVSQPNGAGDYYLQFAMVSNQLDLNATFAEG